ncbi:hypothetical protein IAU59_002493 [Kwoniella sp. CBS 9459]
MSSAPSQALSNALQDPGSFRWPRVHHVTTTVDSAGAVVAIPRHPEITALTVPGDETLQQEPTTYGTVSDNGHIATVASSSRNEHQSAGSDHDIRTPSHEDLARITNFLVDSFGVDETSDGNYVQLITCMSGDASDDVRTAVTASHRDLAPIFIKAFRRQAMSNHDAGLPGTTAPHESEFDGSYMPQETLDRHPAIHKLYSRYVEGKGSDYRGALLTCFEDNKCSVYHGSKSRNPTTVANAMTKLNDLVTGRDYTPLIAASSSQLKPSWQEAVDKWNHPWTAKEEEDWKAYQASHPPPYWDASDSDAPE